MDKCDNSSDSTDSQNKPSKSFLTGALAGLLADGIVHPLDTLRTRSQAGSLSTFPQKSSTLLLTRSIMMKEGINAFYQGFPVVAIATVPAHALYFYGYESSKSWLASVFSGKDSKHKFHLSDTAIHLCSGFYADIMGSLIWTPMEVVKQRMQLVDSTDITGHRDENTARNSLSMISQIWKSEGLLGLYRGFGVALMTYGPYVSLYFAFYEKLKLMSSEYFQTTKGNVPLPALYVMAFTASSVASVITNPLDFIKTRMQTQFQTYGYKKYRNSFHALKSILVHQNLRNDGLSRFSILWSGVGPRTLWMSIGTALTMGFYEGLNRLIS